MYSIIVIVELLALIAQHCSAKETIMAAQEIVEYLRTDSDSGDDSDGESGGVRLVLQLIRLQSLLAKSMFDHLENTIVLLTFHI
jgi:hypothetical protein